MTSVGRDGYGDPDHDDKGAVSAEPPTPPSVPVVPAPAIDDNS
ncbi:hypothetical protein [Angustibacter luteus]|uniref:Uncharacterized protein n=1 Tax=Angustibacter luteus TaxID=658456 RepID=A0ABW1JHL3_9ACTN